MPRPRQRAGRADRRRAARPARTGRSCGPSPVLRLRLLDDRRGPLASADGRTPVVAGVAALVLLAVDADHQAAGNGDAAFGEVAEPQRGQLAAPGAGLSLQCDECQQLVILLN